MYLGIDLGTSGVKATLIAADQRVVASTQAPLQVSRPAPGWSEQQPSDWIEATEAAVAALGARHPAALAAVRGIGLAGQMHGAPVSRLGGVGETRRGGEVRRVDQLVPGQRPLQQVVHEL